MGDARKSVRARKTVDYSKFADGSDGDDEQLESDVPPNFKSDGRRNPNSKLGVLGVKRTGQEGACRMDDSSKGDKEESSDYCEISEDELDYQYSSSDTEASSDDLDEESNHPDYDYDPDFKMVMRASTSKRDGSKSSTRGRKRGRPPKTTPKLRKRRKGESSPPIRPKPLKRVAPLASVQRQRFETIKEAYEKRDRCRSATMKPEQHTTCEAINNHDCIAVPVVLPEIGLDNLSKVIGVGISVPNEATMCSYEKQADAPCGDLEEISPVYSQRTTYCELCGTGHTDESWSHDYLCHDLREGSRKWRCKRCQRTFASVEAFSKHGIRQNDAFPCTLCFRLWPDVLALLRHSLVCTDQNWIRNYQCRMDSTYALSVCKGETPNVVAYRCRHCPRSFTTSTEAAEHSVVHEATRASRGGEHACKYCHFTFTNAKACSVHENFHPDLQCPSCAVRFSNIDSLQKHGNTCFVMKDIPFAHQTCAFCGLNRRGNLSSVSVFERKCENAHPITKLCRTCGVLCESQTKLGEHLRKAHREPVNTFCERCSKYFPTRYLLMVHRTTRCYKVRPRRFLCRFCGVRFASRIGLRRHQLKVQHDRGKKNAFNQKLNFQCTSCFKSFVKRHQLSLHKRLAHPKSVPQCSVCHLEFTSGVELTAHLRVFHGELLFQCHICQKRIRSRIGLHQHLTYAHFQRFMCKLCDVTFEFEQDYEHHLSRHRNEDMCENCGEKRHGQQSCMTLVRQKRYFDTKFITLHQNRWSGNLMKPLRLKMHLECSVCGHPFTGNLALHFYESHWNLHALGSHVLSKCPVCVYDTTEGHADVFVHMMSEHPDKFHKCPKCLLHFTNQETLEFHSKYCHFTPCWQLSTIKVMNAFLKCLECDMVFRNAIEASKHSANRHVVTPEGQLPCPRCFTLHRSSFPRGAGSIHKHMAACRTKVSISCRRCTDTGGTIKWFFGHMKMAHGVVMVNPHPESRNENKTCPHCGQELANQNYLENHLFRRHRDKLGPNSQLVSLCSKCGKEVFYVQLNYHMHTCSGERRFQCDKCDSKFKFKHHLQNHAKTHEEKRFECKPCEMKFRLRHHLESHQRSFHGRQGYKCRDCGKEFKLRWKRTKHGREVHGKTRDDSD